MGERWLKLKKTFFKKEKDTRNEMFQINWERFLSYSGGVPGDLFI